MRPFSNIFLHNVHSAKRVCGNKLKYPKIDRLEPLWSKLFHDFCVDVVGVVLNSKCEEAEANFSDCPCQLCWNKVSGANRPRLSVTGVAGVLGRVPSFSGVGGKTLMLFKISSSLNFRSKEVKKREIFCIVFENQSNHYFGWYDWCVKIVIPKLSPNWNQKRVNGGKVARKYDPQSVSRQASYAPAHPTPLNGIVSWENSKYIIRNNLPRKPFPKCTPMFDTQNRSGKGTRQSIVSRVSIPLRLQPRPRHPYGNSLVGILNFPIFQHFNFIGLRGGDGMWSARFAFSMLGSLILFRKFQLDFLHGWTTHFQFSLGRRGR